MASADLIAFHRMLLNDAERMQAYRQAIFTTVRPGDTVLDAGTGSGIMAMFACQAGARRVYAVDRQDIIFVARQLAAANGYADRIVFLHKDIKDVQLDAPVDVIVSELIAKSVLGEHMAEIIGWCRDRFLKPNGKMLPEQVELCVAPIEHSEMYQKPHLPAASTYAMNFSSFEQRSFNQPVSARIPQQALLAPGQTAYVYHALTAPNSDRFDATLQFESARAGTLHGFGTWFSALLAAGIALSNKPPGIASWDNLFFPLAQPVPLEPGMRIELHFRGRSDAHMPHMWIWDTTVRQGEHVVAQHRQSTFFAHILSPEIIRQSSNSWVPALNPSGKMARLILNLMHQEMGLQGIAERVCQTFPGQFATLAEALSYVRKTVQPYSE